MLRLCDYMPPNVSEYSGGTQVLKMLWQMKELSLNDFAADDHFNRALPSN